MVQAALTILKCPSILYMRGSFLLLFTSMLLCSAQQPRYPGIYHKDRRPATSSPTSDWSQTSNRSFKPLPYFSPVTSTKPQLYWNGFFEQDPLTISPFLRPITSPKPLMDWLQMSNRSPKLSPHSFSPVTSPQPPPDWNETSERKSLTLPSNGSLSPTFRPVTTTPTPTPVFSPKPPSAWNQTLNWRRKPSYPYTTWRKTTYTGTYPDSYDNWFGQRVTSAKPAPTPPFRPVNTTRPKLHLPWFNFFSKKRDPLTLPPFLRTTTSSKPRPRWYRWYGTYRSTKPSYPSSTRRKYTGTHPEWYNHWFKRRVTSAKPPPATVPPSFTPLTTTPTPTPRLYPNFFFNWLGKRLTSAKPPPRTVPSTFTPVTTTPTPTPRSYPKIFYHWLGQRVTSAKPTLGRFWHQTPYRRTKPSYPSSTRRKYTGSHPEWYNHWFKRKVTSSKPPPATVPPT